MFKSLVISSCEHFIAYIEEGILHFDDDVENRDENLTEKQSKAPRLLSVETKFQISHCS